MLTVCSYPDRRLLKLRRLLASITTFRLLIILFVPWASCKTDRLLMNKNTPWRPPRLWCLSSYHQDVNLCRSSVAAVRGNPRQKVTCSNTEALTDYKADKELSSQVIPILMWWSFSLCLEEGKLDNPFLHLSPEQRRSWNRVLPAGSSSGADVHSSDGQHQLEQKPYHKWSANTKAVYSDAGADQPGGQLLTPNLRGLGSRPLNVDLCCSLLATAAVLQDGSFLS